MTNPQLSFGWFLACVICTAAVAVAYALATFSLWVKSKLFVILIVLTCASAWGQSVILQATGPGNVVGIGAVNVRGVAIPRFTIPAGNTNVVIDNDSSLMWMRDAKIGGTKNWHEATNYCDTLSTNEYSDWRLPSMAKNGGSGEWESLIDTEYENPALPSGHPFINVQSDLYWSSATNAGDPGQAWYVDLSNGDLGVITKSADQIWVWPVRGP